LGLGSSGNK
jgi:hypothetical protein